MSIYRIKPIGDGNGFKVNVSDEAGSLRVIGIFTSETAAADWIAVDRHLAKHDHAGTRSDQAQVT